MSSGGKRGANFLSVSLIYADDHSVVSLIRFKSKLFLGLDTLLPHIVNFTGKHLGRRRRRVDTVGLDGNDDGAAVLEEVVGVEGDDTRLVGLGDVGEDDVDHLDEHSVFLRVSGVVDDGDDVGSLLGHTDQLSTGTVREFDGVDDTVGADNVRDVGDGRARGGTEVEDLGSGFDVDVVQTAQDTSSKLTPKRVPHSVLDFFLLAVRVGGGDADPLLAVDGFAGRHVSGNEQVFLALGDVDTFVLVGFEGDGTGTAPAETGLAATTTASTAGRTSTTGSTSSSTTGTTTGSTTTSSAAESASPAGTTASTAPGAASTAATTASVKIGRAHV